MPNTDINGGEQGTAAQRRIDQAGRDIHQAGQETAKAGREAVDEVKHSFSDAADSVKEATRRVIDSGRSYGEEQFHALERQVERQPMTSVAIAAGVGFLVGLLLSR